MDTLIEEQKSKARHKAAFDKWLDEPMVRMGMSMVPAGDHKDTLQMLLRSAFDAGVGCGGADIAISLMTSLLDKKDKDGDRLR